MSRPPDKTLTEVEYEIMEILWNIGDASVREVVDHISINRKVAYTSVMTMLGVMKKKRFVTTSKSGRAFIYKAQISEVDARTGAITNLLSRFFGNSTTAFGQHLLEQNDIDVEELLKLRSDIASERGLSKNREQ